MSHLDKPNDLGVTDQELHELKQIILSTVQTLYAYADEHNLYRTGVIKYCGVVLKDFSERIK